MIGPHPPARIRFILVSELLHMEGRMLLDTLVKLAALGTSGICIFGIFWIGYLILKPPREPDPERHRTLRFFMATCIAIAIVSAAATIFGTWYEKKEIANAMAIVLKSKEGYELQHPSAELKGYITMLQAFVRQMGENPDRRP